MPIWDADFHRTNEEHIRARQAAEQGEVAAYGFTGVSRFAEDQERARLRFEEQEAIQANHLRLCEAQMALWERFTKQLEDAGEKMAADLSRMIDAMGAPPGG